MKEILYDEIPSLDLADFYAGDPVLKATICCEAW